jgi:hypothetical protein
MCSVYYEHPTPAADTHGDNKQGAEHRYRSAPRFQNARVSQRTSDPLSRRLSYSAATIFPAIRPWVMAIPMELPALGVE